MDKQKTLSLIKALSDAPGVSGFEDEAVLALRRYAGELGGITEDAMRNLYVKRPGGEGLPVLMLDAHSDEVGFMVKAIRPNGTLDFIPVGGWVPANVGAHRVLIRNRRGAWIPGITSSKPPHFLSEAEKKAPPDLASMVIDVGAGSAKEVQEDYQISIGAPVVPDARFEYNEERDTMTGKAFDDRLGCAAIIAVLDALKDKKTGVSVTGAFAAQEEVGLRGATVTAQTVKPDIAISLEGCPADDTVVDAYAAQTVLKKGPMLRHIDRLMITNPRFQAFALSVAREKNIPVQEAVRSAGSTDGGVIHLSGKAVPVIVIGIPVRYAHTHYGISSYADFENAVKLACEIICLLNEKTIGNF
jgi:putative aminopeptidase FrvX